MTKLLGFLAICAVCLSTTSASAGTVAGTFIPLAEGTQIDLTANGTLDWIKFGNGEHESTSFLNTTKIGNPVFLPGTLAPLGTAPEGDVFLMAFTGGGLLNFVWGDGNFGMYNDPGPVDTVVTETILPAVNDYPIGLGATFDAKAISLERTMDVYVQGFNADMRITATMSGGGSDSVVVSPSINPASDSANDYSIGIYRITYAGAGEILTVSVETLDPRTDGDDAEFANAGFFAATVEGPLVPEPSSIALAVCALAALGVVARRRRAT